RVQEVEDAVGEDHAPRLLPAPIARLGAREDATGGVEVGHGARDAWGWKRSSRTNRGSSTSSAYVAERRIPDDPRRTVTRPACGGRPSESATARRRRRISSSERVDEKRASCCMASRYSK